MMSRIHAWVLCLLAAAACRVVVGAEPAPAAPEWRPLPLIEQGELSPAWEHTGFGEFTVVDGALRTDNDPRGLGLLYYGKERFGNCQIRVLYRTKEPDSNSGVYVRIAGGLPEAAPLDPVKRSADGELPPDQEAVMEQASEAEQGPWYAVHHGYEVQICESADPGHRTGAIYSLATAKPFPKSAGEWNEMIITLDGPRIEVAINGKTVSRFNSTGTPPPREIWHEPKRGPERPAKGYIGLQNHDPEDVVYFKSVSTRPLPR